MNAIQMELFEPNDDISLQQRQINDMKKSYDARNRRQFAMLNDLGKEIVMIKEELYVLKFKVKEKK